MEISQKFEAFSEYMNFKKETNVFFEVKEWRADKIWAHSYKIKRFKKLQKMSTLNVVLLVQYSIPNKSELLDCQFFIK